MTTRTGHHEAKAGNRDEGVIGPVPGRAGHQKAGPLTSEQVWQAITKRMFAVISYTTPSGDPRCSGVVYKVIGHRIYTAVAPRGWKARHIAAGGRAAVTVPVRRGGILSLVAFIPPATVTFHGQAVVHPAGSSQARALVTELGSLIPAERRAFASIIEIRPEGEFLTYGLGVSLRKMLDPAAAQARVAVC
jgi:Pyridoxamine 5'-phosphate oxidase